MPKLSEISERFAVPKKPFFYIIAGSIFKGAAQTWPPRTTWVRQQRQKKCKAWVKFLSALAMSWLPATNLLDGSLMTGFTSQCKPGKTTPKPPDIEPSTHWDFRKIHSGSFLHAINQAVPTQQRTTLSDLALKIPIAGPPIICPRVGPDLDVELPCPFGEPGNSNWKFPCLCRVLEAVIGAKKNQFYCFKTIVILIGIEIGRFVRISLEMWRRYKSRGDFLLARVKSGSKLAGKHGHTNRRYVGITRP